MIHRHVEEALNLVGMQVHGDEAVYAGCAQQVCHQFCAYGHPWLVFSVLPCPAEVWDHSYNLVGRGALCRINHQQQLHQVVGIWESGLHQKNVAATYRLLEADTKLAVSELLYLQFAESAAQTVADFVCQILCGRSREYLERTVVCHFVVLVFKLTVQSYNFLPLM